MSTISDIAKKAGVSIATVSRVMNGNHNGYFQIKKKVKETMEELGYTPNRNAQLLARCKREK